MMADLDILTMRMDIPTCQVRCTFHEHTTTYSNALKKGKNVEIRGLGRWYFRKLKENFNARNPSTNELIYKPERTKVRFRPAKKLKKLINE